MNGANKPLHEFKDESEVHCYEDYELTEVEKKRNFVIERISSRK